MATEQQKSTYSAAEVAVLEETILQQKAEIDELKRKLEHMNGSLSGLGLLRCLFKDPQQITVR